PERERAVRAALNSLLLTALDKPLDTFQLDLGQKRGGPLSALAAQVRRLLARRAPEDSPLREPVFARFTSGWAASRPWGQFAQALLRQVWGDPEGGSWRFWTFGVVPLLFLATVVGLAARWSEEKPQPGSPMDVYSYTLVALVAETKKISDGELKRVAGALK